MAAKISSCRSVICMIAYFKSVLPNRSIDIISFDYLQRWANLKAAAHVHSEDRPRVRRRYGPEPVGRPAGLGGRHAALEPQAATQSPDAGDRGGHAGGQRHTAASAGRAAARPALFPTEIAAAGHRALWHPADGAGCFKP